MNAFVEFARDRFGRIDVIFNNAGVMPVSPMSALKTDEWDRIIDINFKGVLNGIAAVLPVMNAQGSGHIISTASTAAHAVGAQFGVYCASKYAVRAIMEGLRQEMTQIRVTTISPGVTVSELGHDISVADTAAAVGQLQLDVMKHRLLHEYSVEADYESVEFTTARWITPRTEGKTTEDVRKIMEQFTRKNDLNLAIDAHGDLAYLAPNKWNLAKVEERFPDVRFAATREHT